jgi:mannose-6-phosphate isomerase-like protein (cupin superfamily)
MNKSVRRVVTGHDKSGKAIVISDGPAPFVHTTELRPGYSATDVWRTNATPAPVVFAAEEPTLGPRRQLPAKHGTVIRISEIPPDGERMGSMDAAASKKMFEFLGNTSASTFAASGVHPLMHRTETIDYAIVLEGELTLILDDAEVPLKAGDVTVQCGTNHAWSNRSGKPCRIAFILVDGAFEPELKSALDKR